MRHAAVPLAVATILLLARVFPEELVQPVASACSTVGDAAALGIAAVVLAVAHGKARRREREHR